MPETRRLPQCWGHRGASVSFPENTIASFEAAIRDGVDGIESDVHVSKDNVVLITTDFTGVIKDCNPDGMKHARTKKEPKQSIPTFSETVALLMKMENRHIHLIVDVKAQNDPQQLFSLVHTIIASHPQWQNTLAPRILLAGKGTPPLLPSAISINLWIAKTYLWNDVECVSVWYNALMGWEGQRFRDDVRRSGKKLMVFTVNEPHHLMEMVQWDVDGIVTDNPNRWLELKSALEANYDTTTARYSRLFLYTTPTFYWPFTYEIQKLAKYVLERWGGPLDEPVLLAVE
ncbi:PLC-like phosphodiesterase [Mycena sp. CBHHK59/15]|nr:PLC-like phosphodiesterase [Mycena sp. CBHHK59/15]KAJ6630861.1 PLC-like phosphodiesterase [Mycena sp. CBHHK59/15]